MTEQETLCVNPVPSDNKRKLDDLIESKRPQPEEVNVGANVESGDDVNGDVVVSDLKDSKRIRLDAEAVGEISLFIFNVLMELCRLHRLRTLLYLCDSKFFSEL